MLRPLMSRPTLDVLTRTRIVCFVVLPMNLFQELVSPSMTVDRLKENETTLTYCTRTSSRSSFFNNAFRTCFSDIGR